MKEIQIPRKSFARSSELGAKRLKDPEMKNRKVILLDRSLKSPLFSSSHIVLLKFESMLLWTEGYDGEETDRNIFRRIFWKHEGSDGF